MKSSCAERTLALSELYYRCTGYVAPGHDAPMAMLQEPSSEENRERFRNWLVMEGFDRALDRIVSLEAQIREMQ